MFGRNVIKKVQQVEKQHQRVLVLREPGFRLDLDVAQQHDEVDQNVRQLALHIDLHLLRVVRKRNARSVDLNVRNGVVLRHLGKIDFVQRQVQKGEGVGRRLNRYREHGSLANDALAVAELLAHLVVGEPKYCRREAVASLQCCLEFRKYESFHVA